MRQALINENADLVAANPRYVMRITGNDKEGQAELGNFIDPESTYPVLVTTSRLLSTGVDAQTCRLIVLDREIGSMTEFKQIVGRGTRVHEDTQKYYFTLMDFRGATSHFADPEFDGDPVQINEPGPDDPIEPPEPEPGPDGEPSPATPGETIVAGPTFTGGASGGQKIEKIYVDGVGATIVAERVEYLDENGKLITESLRDYTRKALRAQFASLDDFLKRWKQAEHKQAVLDEIAAKGLPVQPILDELGKDLDPFDLICHVAFDRKPLTRRERADGVKKRDVFAKYGAQARAVLDALLTKFADEGVLNLDDTNVLRIAPISLLGTPVQLIRAFGGKPQFEQAVHDLQAELYEETA
jgi:type I restriction enzyme R subunit